VANSARAGGGGGGGGGGGMGANGNPPSSNQNGVPRGGSGNPSNGGGGVAGQGLKHDPGISLDWSAEEQSILEEGLNMYVCFLFLRASNSFWGFFIYLGRE
jgi:hypothetical protein